MPKRMHCEVPFPDADLGAKEQTGVSVESVEWQILFLNADWRFSRRVTVTFRVRPLPRRPVDQSVRSIWTSAVAMVHVHTSRGRRARASDP